MSAIKKKTSNEVRSARSQFQLTFVDEVLKDGAVPDYLVEGVLPSEGSVGFVGDSGSGKSLLASHLAACVATGWDFFGRPCKQGLVVYLWGEGRSGARPRLQAIEQFHGLNLHRAPLAISKVATSLIDDLEVAHVRAAIHRAEAGCGRKLALLVVDTLARHIVPGDESKAQDMSRFLGAIDYLRENGTAIVCHHTGHGSRRARGSSNWKQNLDAEYILGRKGDVITATCKKMKDDDELEPLLWRIQISETGLSRRNGKPLTSAVLSSCGSETGIPEPTGQNQRKLLREVRRLRSERKETVWTPEELRKIGRGLGMRKNSARSAVQSVQNHGYLVATEGGLCLANQLCRRD